MPCTCETGCDNKRCGCRQLGYSTCMPECKCKNCMHPPPRMSRGPTQMVASTSPDDIAKELSVLKKEMKAVKKDLAWGAKAVDQLAQQVQSPVTPMVTVMTPSVAIAPFHSPTTLMPRQGGSDLAMVAAHGHLQSTQTTLRFNSSFNVARVGIQPFFSMLSAQGLLLVESRDGEGLRRYNYFFRDTSDLAMIVTVTGNSYTMMLNIDVESRNAQIHNDFCAWLTKTFG